MKFLSDLDAKLFLWEVHQEIPYAVTKDYQPTDEELTSFITKRDRESYSLKDHDKSRKAKEGWRKNRADRMRGIKSYHKSTEGKRFHKRLGRFLASRITSRDESHDQAVLEYLKGLGAAKNSLITELEYYHTLTEQVELESVVYDYAIPMLSSIESKILSNEELTEDEFCFLMDITETASVVRSLATKANVTVDKVEGYWKEIKDALMRDGKKESDPQFYGLLVSILKKKLNLT